LRVETGITKMRTIRAVVSHPLVQGRFALDLMSGGSAAKIISTFLQDAADWLKFAGRTCRRNRKVELLFRKILTG
jgi:hypothetical protein